MNARSSRWLSQVVRSSQKLRGAPQAERRPERGAVHVWAQDEYLGPAWIEAADARGGGAWYQTAYRAAVRVFGPGAYELRHEGPALPVGSEG